MCIHRAREYEKDEVVGWKVFWVTDRGRIRSPHRSHRHSAFKPGVVYTAKGFIDNEKRHTINNNPNCGFHIFTKKQDAQRYKESHFLGESLVIKKVRAIDVRWKGVSFAFDAYAYRNKKPLPTITARQMEILP